MMWRFETAGHLILKGLLVLSAINLVSCSTSFSPNCGDGNAKARPFNFSITDYGAVGDGVTLNTKAFQNATSHLSSFADKGGAQLFIPAGKWLTGTFSLVSHLTLFLDKDAVILGSTDTKDFPLIPPLPSYGRGRELPGNRHQSLIWGTNLTDVIITGNNGTIDGQGEVWWDLFLNKTLDFTRPHLLELMYSNMVLLSNLTFQNSPFWAIHPVYSSQVLIKDVTVLAPPDSPNTDAIDPDSSDNLCIEDCYINTGDDVIAIKSGWDEYGIAYGHPSFNISIRRIVGEGHHGAGISFGSEMSGGISDVQVEDIQIFNSLNGIRLKTAPGRGGYMRNILVSNVSMTNVSVAILIQSNYGEHPDDSYNASALPVVSQVSISNVFGKLVKTAGLLGGTLGDNFTDICLSDILLNVTSKHPWNCSFIEGYSYAVLPDLCDSFKPGNSSVCYPSGSLDATTPSPSIPSSSSGAARLASIIGVLPFLAVWLCLV